MVRILSDPGRSTKSLSFSSSFMLRKAKMREKGVRGD